MILAYNRLTFVYSCIFRATHLFLTPQLIGSQILRIHSAPVIAVALGRNAKTVYSAGLDGAIHVVSLSGQVVDAFQGASAVPEPCRALLKNYQSVARALVPLEEGNIMDFLLQAGDPIRL